MKLEKATHKTLLYKAILPVQFPIEKLADASNAAKKLLDGSERTEEAILFVDKEQDFTVDEWVVLKDLLREVKTAPIEGAEALLELRKLFEL